MSDYNQTITRNDAEALIPEEVSREIIQNVPQQSFVMQLARRLPNMSRKQLRLPVLSGLAHAHFVGGDTGLKKTTKMQWQNKFINAGEIAAIVPIPEAVLDDADYDIWGQVRPNIEEAIGQVFDAAVLYGTNAPGDWPDAIVPGATSAGHVVADGQFPTLYDDIFGVGGVFSHVEEDGFNITGHIAALKLRAKLRGLKDQEDRPLFLQSLQAAVPYSLDGNSILFPTNGAIDPNESLMISGDWNQLVYAIRQDITFKVLDQAAIFDDQGELMYNLAQQDMVALRVVFRAGWQLPNPVNRVQPEEEQRYPFAVLTPQNGDE